MTRKRTQKQKMTIPPLNTQPRMSRKRNKRKNRVTVNQAISRTQPIPRLKPTEGPAVRDGIAMAHREYWGTISGKTATTPTVFRFNPGKSQMYMLDQMGLAFNDYVVEEVVVEVVGVGPTTGSANLKWCLDFKPDLTPPDAKTIMQHVPSVSQAGWQSASKRQTKQRLMRRSMYATNVANPGEDSDAFLLVAIPTGDSDVPTWDVYCGWRAVFYHPGPGN
nr:MAG: hypothetical protein [Skomarfal virus 5]